MLAMRPLLRLTCLALLAAAAVRPAPAEEASAAAAGGAPALMGRVVGPDGTPVAGARVRVLAMGDRWPPLIASRSGMTRPVVVTTAEDGSFLVDGVEGPKLRARIEATGFAPFDAEDVSRIAVLDVRLNSGVPLTGRVLDMASSEAVPGATVLAYDRGAEWFGPESASGATADDDGRFTLTHLPVGSVTLEAWSPRHAVSRTDVPVVPERLEEATAPPDPIELVLQLGGRVAGRVLNSDGSPSADALVRIRPTSGKSLVGASTSLPRRLVTDSGGEFAFDGVPVARFQVIASKDGRSHARSMEIAIEQGTDLHDLEVTFDEFPALVFRLLDVDDKPVAVSAVVLSPTLGPDETRGVANWGRGVSVIPDLWIDSDEDGYAVVRVPSAGTFDVVILPVDGLAIGKQETRLRLGEATDLGTLRSIEGLFVSGHVSDTKGNLVVGAEVEATCWVDMGLRRRTTKTKPDGSFKIGGLDEAPPLRITVTADGYCPEVRERAMPGDCASDFTLERTGSIVGKVVHDDGSTPSFFRIRVRPEASARDSRAVRSGRESWFRDTEGGFRMDDIAPGPVTVEASGGGMAPSRKSGVRVDAEGTVDIGTLVLGDGSTVRGRVFEAAGGAPIVGAILAAYPTSGDGRVDSRTDGMTGSTASEPDGSFALGGLEERAYTLTVEHPDYAAAGASVEIPSGGDPPEIIVELMRGGTLTGTVRDAARQPVPGVKIKVVRDMFGSADERATTGDDGVYRISRLSPGSYTVVKDPGGASIAGLDSRLAVIKEAQTTVVDFDESAKHKVTGRVLRGERTVPGAMIVFAPGSSGLDAPGSKATEADPQGRYELGLDTSGQYTVYLRGGDALPGQRSLKVVVPDMPTVSLDLAVRAGGVEGRVVDPDGRPIASALVSVRGDDSVSWMPDAMDESGPDGRFAIASLEPGSYRVSASAIGYAPSPAQSVLVDDGRLSPDVALRLERGHVVRGRVVDPAGRGVENALVVAGKTGSVAPDAPFERTGVNGGFTLRLSDASSYDFAALAAGHAVSITSSVPPDQTEVLIQLGPGGRARIEVVSTDGAPVAGARVLLRANPPYLGSDLASFFARPQATDADGRNSVPALRPGTYDVIVELGPRSRAAQLSVNEGGEAFVRVTLP